MFATSCSVLFWFSEVIEKILNTTLKIDGITVLKLQFCRQAFFFLLKKE